MKHPQTTIPHNIDVEFRVFGIQPILPTDTKQGLFRILQEACSNIRKHSQATKVRIVLNYQNEAVHLHVEDNGVGFDSQARLEHSFGITCMRERARMLGGQVTVHSAHGKGTTIEAIIPV